MKKLNIFFLFIVFAACKGQVKTESIHVNHKAVDSIFTETTGDGKIIRKIYYPSKKKDSFNLMTKYINNKISDSGYISDSGIRNFFWVHFKEDEKFISEILNINKKEYLNQFWRVANGDTIKEKCFQCGNSYLVKLMDKNIVKDEKNFIEIILEQSYEPIINDVFFLYPYNGSFTSIKEDFSNIDSIKKDTIHSLTYKSDKRIVYSEYWDKRTVQFGYTFPKSGKNYIRGILVERKDSVLNNELRYLDRYLYVNKEVYVHEKDSLVNSPAGASL